MSSGMSSATPDDVNSSPSLFTTRSGNCGNPASVAIVFSTFFAFFHKSSGSVKSVSPETMVLQAAGISSGQDVYDAILYGGDATGGTSGIVAAANPFATLEEMFAALDRVRTDISKEA